MMTGNYYHLMLNAQIYTFLFFSLAIVFIAIVLSQMYVSKKIDKLEDRIEDYSVKCLFIHNVDKLEELKKKIEDDFDFHYYRRDQYYSLMGSLNTRIMQLKHEQQVYKTSEEWAAIFTDVKILDPDGWDRTNFEYSFKQEKISMEEYKRRLMSSTVKGMLEIDKISKDSEMLLAPAELKLTQFTGQKLDYGRYLVVRKDGKMHLETYNGTGWAYNHTSIVSFYLPMIN